MWIDRVTIPGSILTGKVRRHEYLGEVLEVKAADKFFNDPITGELDSVHLGRSFFYTPLSECEYIPK